MQMDDPGEWMPQAGPQTAFVMSPLFEVVYGGARGGGKTDAALGDFAFHARGGTRLAASATVTARITELAERRETNCQAGAEETVVALLALAKAANTKTAAGAREARLARLEANRLWQALATPRARRAPPDRP